jgi:hypothetical protein
MFHFRMGEREVRKNGYFVYVAKLYGGEVAFVGTAHEDEVLTLPDNRRLRALVRERKVIWPPDRLLIGGYAEGLTKAAAGLVLAGLLLHHRRASRRTLVNTEDNSEDLHGCLDAYRIMAEKELALS